MVEISKYNPEYNELQKFNISQVALHNACIMCDVDVNWGEQLSLSLLQKIEEIEELMRKANPNMDPDLIGIRSTQLMAKLILEDKNDTSN